MTDKERLADPSDVVRLYRKYGGSQALRRVAELALRHGANVAFVSELGEHPEWKAECQEIKQRFGFTGYSQSAVCLDFVKEEARRQPKYIGYALVRPRPNGSLLEGLVPPPPDGDRSYLTCGTQWNCDLQRVPIEADQSQLWGCTFVQQDTHTGVCAHACIRSVSMLLNSRFRCDVVTFPEITARARCHDPRDGLKMDEMKEVLRSLGCDLHEFTVRRPGAEQLQEVTEEIEQPEEEAARGAEGIAETRPPQITFQPDEVIYRYVESELPVLVVIPTQYALHVLSVVGHSFDRDSWWPEALGGYYPRVGEEYPWLPSSLWTDSFYVQDDNFGPYQSMPKDLCREHVRWILVPIPKEIGLCLTGEVVEPYTAYLLYDPTIIGLMLLEENTSEWKSLLAESQINRRVVLRTLLVRGEVFRKHVRSRACRYAPAVKAVYRDIEIPSWIWLVEVSVPDLYGPAMMKLGEVLIDPTAQSVTGLEPVLALHLPGVIWPRPSSEEPLLVDGDRPTRVYSRKTFAEYVHDTGPGE